MSPLLLLLGRVIYGGFFLFNGLNHFTKKAALVGYAKSKGVPAPEAAVLLTGIMLVAGGLGVILGMFTQWAFALIVVSLLGMTFKMHAFWNAQDAQSKMMDQVQFMKNMALMGSALMLLNLVTPWAYSLSL